MSSVVDINPLSRVEGHGQVKVHLDGIRVERVELCLTESPRLFEALLLGRSFAEVPEIICRICSLCSTIHKVTALIAVEKAFGIEVSPVTRLTRELIVAGGQIQSHSLHLYCLLLPDLLQLRGVAELAREAPEQLKRGLAIKRVGNLIQETVGGRLIHPVNIALGGLGKRLDGKELMRLSRELEQILPACRDSIELFRSPSPFPRLPEPNYLALEPGDASYYGEHLCLRDRGSFPVQRYREFIAEEVAPQSHAKFARVLDLSPTVGSLSRLNFAPPQTTGARELFETVRGEILARDIRGNTPAQAIELYQAAERAYELVQQLLALGKEGGTNVTVAPRSGWGSAACEAPRGLLIHSYGFDEAGICREADVITPTSLNQGALARDLYSLACALEGCEPGEMSDTLERLVRCYDPCISCSVHLVTR